MVAAISAIGLLAACTAKPVKPAGPSYLAAFPNFAPDITAQFPGDVDVSLKTRLEKEQKFAEVQREFDLYSWQLFLALNWPTDNEGKAAPKLTDTALKRPKGTRLAVTFVSLTLPDSVRSSLPKGRSTG